MTRPIQALSSNMPVLVPSPSYLLSIPILTSFTNDNICIPISEVSIDVGLMHKPSIPCDQVHPLECPFVF